MIRSVGFNLPDKLQEQTSAKVRERLEARASALSRSSGISHEDAFIRACAANPDLARVAGIQAVA